MEELHREEIAEILRIFAASDLEELRIEIGGTRLYLSKHSGAAASPASPAGADGWAGSGATAAPDAVASSGPAADPSAVAAPDRPVPAPSGAADPAPADGLVELRSPLLGVFYRRPSPDQPALVELGDQVGANDPVCIIDVMKMFTRIPAGTAGRIVEVCAQDGQLVEHGQLLMRIQPR